MAKMTEEELQSVVSSEIEDARDYIDEDISPIRAAAYNYYLGRPFGNEVEGRSKVISQDVRDTVNALLPSLMKIYTTSEKVVEFSPTSPEDVEMAAQATDYCNFVYMKDNDGYLNLYHTFKDAMIKKVGIQKIWWDERKDVSIQEYEGLDEATIAILMQEPDVEVTDIEVEMRTEMVQQQDPVTGQIVTVPTEVPVYECKVKKTTEEGRICVAVLPPEEFLISRTARSLEDASIVAHRALVSASDLIAMGIDRELVEENITTQDFWDNEEAQDRSDFTEENPGFTNNRSMQRVLYIESYIRVDFDGDGIAERRKICTIGDGHTIVKNEPCDLLPFADFTVDSEPHLSAVEATSIADKVADLQLIKSMVWRNSLDSMAQTLNPRTVILEGKVNVQDVLKNEVGAVIRETAPGAVRELVTQPIFQQAFGMLDYLDSVKESRTGISKAAAGLDPDALKNTTMNAANFQVTATQSQMELVARNLANGFKKAFAIMLQIMTREQDKPRMIKLRNKWVPIDPRQWNPRMDVEINVALGRGTDQEKLMILAMIAQKQEMILAQMGPMNPLVSLPQYSNTLTKIVELSGFKNTSAYITDLPDDFQLPPPPPMPADPNAASAELLAQVEREKAQMKMQVDGAKLQADAAKTQANQQIEAFKLQLDREKFMAERMQAEFELQMQREQMMIDARVKEAELRIKEAELLINQLKEQGNESTNEEGQGENQARQEGLLAQALAMMAQSQAEIAKIQAAPRLVVRDQMGRIVGTETGVANDNQIPPSI